MRRKRKDIIVRINDEEDKTRKINMYLDNQHKNKDYRCLSGGG